MEIRIINPLVYPDWDDEMLSLEEHSFFHSSHWARVLCDTYRYTPLYFTSSVNGRICGALPFMEINSFLTGHRGVSLPFTDYCEPLLDKNVPLGKMLEVVIAYGRHAAWNSFEMRMTGSPSEGAAYSACYYGHTLELFPSEAYHYTQLHRGTKSSIAKSLKSGVKVAIESSIEAMEDFYRLNCITRKMHGLPPQPFEFFRNIHDHIISKKHGLVVLASHGDRTIAGAVYFHFGKKAIYKYGASDRRYQHLRANNLVMWEVIRWYAHRGFESLCFGRTETGNQGLIQFKDGWGTKSRLLRYYRYDFSENAFSRNSMRKKESYNRIFLNMPTPLLKITGSLLYRHMG